MFVGCVTATKISDTVPPKKPELRIIQINPNINMSVREQILWYDRLEQMNAQEKFKTFRMWRDGMFKTEEQMKRLDMIYPKKPKGPTI